MKNVRIIFCVFYAFLAKVNGAEPIGSLAEIRALSDEQAGQHLPLQLEATVIYVDNTGYDLIVGDGVFASYCEIEIEHLSNDQRPRLGDRLHVRGTTRLDGFSAHIRADEWRIVGHDEMPRPYRISAQEIFLPKFDASWVEVPAVVIGTETGGLAFTLAVEVFGEKFKVDIPRSEDASSKAAELMQRPVMMRGVLATTYNDLRQLTGRHFFVPSFDCLIPTGPAIDVAQAQTRQIAELLQSSVSINDLVRVEGIITQHDKKGFYLQDHTAATFVQGGKADQFPVGTRVSVEGYGAIAAFRPTMRAIRVQEIERNGPLPVEPMNFHATDVIRFQNTRVTLQADLGSIRSFPHEIILQCTSNGVSFEAVLPPEAGTNSWREGDALRLTGICELTTTHPIPRREWIDGFRLRLPGPQAVEILRRAPWWTTERLLTALGLMTGLALLGGGGTLFFRRVVREQARVIGAQLSSEAVSEERDRMARELHDTLEQQLTGVSMQLESIVQSSHEKSPAVAERLMLATRMLEHSREEARRSVWDLRNRLLETHGLTAALKSIVESAAIDGGPQVELRLSGDASAISSSVDYQLLRMTQEALTNALKHAKAQHVIISLESTTEIHCLTIKDDGVGFDSQVINPTSAPHFGLIGLRERAEKIGARLEIETAIGQGCTIRIQIPRTHIS